VQIKLSNKDQEIFVFQLDQNNYIKFCPDRGGVITNWVSDGNEILYFDETRFMDKTKSIRGGIPISKAFKKSSSIQCASKSPSSLRDCCNCILSL